MHNYRITKYNPAFRTREGCYTKEEWTSCFDIGKTFENVTLTLDQYIKVENAYVRTIILCMEFNNIEHLSVVDLEKQNIKKCKKLVYPKPMIDLSKHIREGLIVDKQNIERITRLTLREMMWCKLENDCMFVHFGWDYYMYIGTMTLPSHLITQIQQMELFVELYDSPYL